MAKLWLVDWICQAQIAWQEALLKKYPRLMRNSRAIHKSAGNQDRVSFETFVRRELVTYSVNTLRLYAHQIEKAQKSGKNLCETTLENTVHLLGFQSLVVTGCAVSILKPSAIPHTRRRHGRLQHQT